MMIFHVMNFVDTELVIFVPWGLVKIIKLFSINFLFSFFSASKLKRGEKKNFRHGFMIFAKPLILLREIK